MHHPALLMRCLHPGLHHARQALSQVMQASNAQKCVCLFPVPCCQGLILSRQGLHYLATPLGPARVPISSVETEEMD